MFKRLPRLPIRTSRPGTQGPLPHRGHAAAVCSWAFSRVHRWGSNTEHLGLTGKHAGAASGDTTDECRPASLHLFLQMPRKKKQKSLRIVYNHTVNGKEKQLCLRVTERKVWRAWNYSANCFMMCRSWGSGVCVCVMDLVQNSLLILKAPLFSSAKRMFTEQICSLDHLDRVKNKLCEAVCHLPRSHWLKVWRRSPAILTVTLPLCPAAMRKLLNIYHTAIRPVEQAFKYNELRQHEVTGKTAGMCRHKNQTCVTRRETPSR